MNKPNSKVEHSHSKVVDSLLWLAVIIIVAAAVVANFYFRQQPLYIRGAAIAVAVAVALVIWLQTAMGGRFHLLYHGSRVELRKVVWPTSQETLQSSLVVLGVVALMSVVLWLFDSLFGWLVSLLIAA